MALKLEARRLEARHLGHIVSYNVPPQNTANGLSFPVIGFLMGYTGMQVSSDGEVVGIIVGTHADFIPADLPLFIEDRHIPMTTL